MAARKLFWKKNDGIEILAVRNGASGLAWQRGGGAPDWCACAGRLGDDFSGRCTLSDVDWHSDHAAPEPISALAFVTAKTHPSLGFGFGLTKEVSLL